ASEDRMPKKTSHLLTVLIFLALVSACVSLNYQTRSFRTKPNVERSLRNLHAANQKKTIVPKVFLKWRRQFLLKIRHYDSRGLVRGVFLGEDTFIEDSTKDIFRRTGLYHLLAASGFNCWVVSFYLTLLSGVLLFFAGVNLRTRWYLSLKIRLP